MVRFAESGASFARSWKSIDPVLVAVPEHLPRLALLLVCQPALTAQTFSIGLSVGGQITNDIGQPWSSLRTSRLLLGPTIRVQATNGFGFETGVLYKDIEFDYSVGRPGLAYRSYKMSANMGQLPTLFRYEHRFGKLTPYVNAGWTVRWMTGAMRNGQYCIQLPSEVCTPFTETGLANKDRQITNGPAAGGGIAFGTGMFQLSPEVRFTRWLQKAIAEPPSAQNEVDLLVRVAVRFGR